MKGPPFSTLIIGVGNPYRNDDAAGLLVAAEVKNQAGAGVQVITQTGEGSALMEAWQGTQTVVLVDAARSQATPGTIQRLEAHRQSIPSAYFHYSTHAFGVAEAIELARVLNRLPERLIIYGIEGADFAPGTTLTPEVAAAVSQVAAQVLQELPKA